MVKKFIHAIKMGWLVPKKPKDNRDQVDKFFDNVFDCW